MLFGKLWVTKRSRAISQENRSLRKSSPVSWSILLFASEVLDLENEFVLTYSRRFPVDLPSEGDSIGGDRLAMDIWHSGVAVRHFLPAGVHGQLAGECG